MNLSDADLENKQLFSYLINETILLQAQTLQNQQCKERSLSQTIQPFAFKSINNKTLLLPGNLYFMNTEASNKITISAAEYHIKGEDKFSWSTLPNSNVDKVQLLSESVTELDNMARKEIYNSEEALGTCVVIAIVDENEIVIANAGDSRATRTTIDPKLQKVTVTLLTNDHSMDNPLETLMLKIRNKSYDEVNARLAPSRHIGGTTAPEYMRPKPDITRQKLELKPGCIEHLSLSSDGIWDHMSVSLQADLLTALEFGIDKLEYKILHVYDPNTGKQIYKNLKDNAEFKKAFAEITELKNLNLPQKKLLISRLYTLSDDTTDVSVCLNDVVENKQTVYLGMYDGHGGAQVSEFVSQNAAKVIVSTIQKLMEEDKNKNTTISNPTIKAGKEEKLECIIQ